MKKKGFTLIELLAVIVVLAIIALIAVPVTLNVIDDAKKGAAKVSALNYAKAVEQEYELSLLTGDTKFDNLETDIDGCYTQEQLNELVKVNGKTPSNDTQICLDKKDIITSINGSIGGYEFKYENGQLTIEGEVLKTNGSVNAPTARALVYNGEVQELINEGSSTTGEIQYKLEDGSYSTTIPTGINAGTYKIYYRVIGDSTHYDIEEKSINVTINKANNTLSLSSSIGTVTYPDPITFEITNNVSNGTLSCESSDDDAATCSINGNIVTVTPGVKESNNVNITIKSSETDNYNKGQAVFALVSQSGVLSYTANSYTGIYDGEEHTISVTSLDSIIKYGTIEGTYNLTSAPTYINVGTYTVYYQVTKTGYVTVTGSKTVTINKAAGSVTAPTAKTLTYTGSAQALVNAGSTTTGTIQYKLEGGSYSTTIPTGTNAGTYKVYYKVIGDSNHLDVAESSINVTINKATGSVTAPTAKTLTYNGLAQALVNAGSSSTGTIQYKLEGGSYSTSIPTATNVGTYTVYYRVVGNSNYNDVAESSINVTIKGGPTKVAATASDTHKGIVYLDPTDLTKICNASNSVSTPGTKTGCMKWYIYDDSGDTYKMILDHNTTAKVAYNSTRSNASMKEVATALSNDTSTWNSSLNARLIEANEIARITGNETFDQATTPSGSYFYFDSNTKTRVANSTNKSAYAWLYDYIENCTTGGCNIADSSTMGYWTSSPIASNTRYAWYVYCLGGLYYDYVDHTTYGVRPVISVSKSIIY